MKHTIRITLLMMAFGLFFLCSWFGRYTPISLEKSKPAFVQVEIKGEVISPGVYTLETGSSLEDLLAQAGGISQNASTDTLSLMEVLQDGQIVVIPEKTSEKQISISTASREELQTLPGIGPAMADRIVEYRQAHPFGKLEDLMEVKGIGEKTFAKMKGKICL